MSPELEAKLIKDFPKLFADVDKPMTESLMCFGCAVGDGWFNILYQLCADLTELAKKEGPEFEERFRFSQIKEKFALLRIYATTGTDAIDHLIDKAETASASVCELCGNEGKVEGKSWLSTLCDSCRNKKR